MTGVVTTFDANWSRTSLLETLRTRYGVGSDAGLPEDLRFVRGVVDLARTRYAVNGETVADQPIVFLLHPKDPIGGRGGRELSKRIPMLDEGRHPMAGRIWLVNHVVNEGVSLHLDPSEDDTDIFEFIKVEMGLGDHPAAVLDLRDQKFVARFYPDGLNSPSNAQRQDLAKANLTTAEVYEVLDGIYQNELCTPEAQGHVGTTWLNAAEGIPIKEAELMVQRVLKVGLTARYLGVFSILQEQPSPSGRYDLMIEQPDPLDRTTSTKHVVLELKVLREKTNTGNPVGASVTEKALRKGLKQAAIYRDKREARTAALCVYDMRKVPLEISEVFHGLVKKAERRSVDLWAWHLFRSPDDYRDHEFGLDDHDDDGAEL